VSSSVRSVNKYNRKLEATPTKSVSGLIANACIAANVQERRVRTATRSIYLLAMAVSVVTWAAWDVSTRILDTVSNMPTRWAINVRVVAFWFPEKSSCFSNKSTALARKVCCFHLLVEVRLNTNALPSGSLIPRCESANDSSLGIPIGIASLFLIGFNVT
jgi:hypothetical protein